MPDLPLDLRADVPGDQPGRTRAPHEFRAPRAPLVGGLDERAGYVGFGLATSIARDSGLGYAALAAAEDGETVFWRVCAATSRKVVEFVSQRMGARPEAPHVDTGDANDVLVGYVSASADPKTLPDGTEIFTLAGRYVYVQRRAVSPRDPVLIPNSALGLGGLRQLDPQQFSKKLLPRQRSPRGFAAGIDY